MNKIFVEVSNGAVTDVYATNEELEVVVIDDDVEEAEEQNEKHRKHIADNGYKSIL